MTPQLLKLIAENKSLKDKIDQYRQTTGLLPYIDDFVIKGGYHVVKNIAERDSIDCCHRKLGMKVLVVGSDLSFKEYILKTDNCKKNIWEEVDVTIEENEVFLIEDYSELSEDLTTQKELNLILKQLILNLQTALDGKQDKLSSYDESILIENGGNIESNISLFEEYFEQQECELSFEPIQIVAVYQDGIKLLDSEYEIILPKKIKIKEYVDENIQVQYTHLKS